MEIEDISKQNTSINKNIYCKATLSAYKTLKGFFYANENRTKPYLIR